MAVFQPRGTSRRPSREVRDGRRPLYTVFILDTSTSMEGVRCVATENGEKRIRKIDELNDGLTCALDSLRKFEAQNVIYRNYIQIIHLDSYGKAYFPDFMPLSGINRNDKIVFNADGVTCLENSLSTLKSLLNPKALSGCNHAVNVILMSDGYPTNTDGYTVGSDVYMKIIGEFGLFLENNRLRGNVDLYSISVGEDACEDMLRKFADSGKFYKVGDTESLADKLDFVTRRTIVGHTSQKKSTPVDPLASGSMQYEIDFLACLKEACLECLPVCPIMAISCENGIVSISAQYCFGCGECASKCPANAIQPLSPSGIGGNAKP